jgi:hypothetical protein
MWNHEKQARFDYLREQVGTLTVSEHDIHA